MENIEEFYQHLMQRIFAESNVEEEELFQEQVFIDNLIDVLHDAGELNNGIRCQHKTRGIKIDGYDINPELNTLDLLVADFRSGEAAIAVVTPSDYNRSFKRARTFIDRCMKDTFVDGIEESAEIHDLIRTVREEWDNLRRIRIILITNGQVKKFDGSSESLEGRIDVSYQIWDLNRMYRFVSSGNKGEPINVDISAFMDQPLNYVSAPSQDGSYDTYLCVIPGTFLFDLYDKWGTKLLERNVRAYLQARGKVNRGIRKTLKEEGHMFMAYNNGITVTAQSVKIIGSQDGKCIQAIEDFQIVNGGQTTASIWHARSKDKANLVDVYVQMKLTVISDEETLDSMVPLISEYSNSQNKVNTADFSANDPFHINVEKLSRRVYAPDTEGGNNETLWFYERSRGSYDETRNRERTPARIKAWDKIHPRRQKFDKVQLAKLEKTWMLQPHVVSTGGQKNFSSFQLDIKEQGLQKVDEKYFKELVAKLIIWKEAEKIVSRQGIPGYRANIVTYTLASILKHTSRRINLADIWEKQEISLAFENTVDAVAYKIRELITDTEYNVTEYCKKKVCWEKIQDNKTIKDTIPTSLKKELINVAPPTYTNTTTSPMIKVNEKDEQTIERVKQVESAIWKKLSRWGKQTGALQTWENGICYSVGKRLSYGNEPTLKQAKNAEKIYEKAKNLGFDAQSELE
ncbi:AIPR family protein [Robertkochia aurantiaca]|uniref:AIPR family protein n=1 Tax=Robertkochia aurantiaca TaxID=2873700 RepID=UPI001CC98F97|nr:AIPR family protein [Robertkochia sp. 3YJGBD-33]